MVEGPQLTHKLTDRSGKSGESDIFIVLGIGRYYGLDGLEGFDGEGGDVSFAADSIRLITTSEDEAQFLVSILNAPRLVYLTQKKQYEDRKARIREQEVPAHLMSPPPGPTDTSDYKSWHTELREAFSRCHKRWETELPANPPVRPTAMSEKYVIVKMPLGKPVDLLLANVVAEKD